MLKLYLYIFTFCIVITVYIDFHFYIPLIVYLSMPAIHFAALTLQFPHSGTNKS